MFAVLYMYTEVSFSAHTNKHTHTQVDLTVGCCLITPLILYIIMYVASSTSYTSRLCLLLAGMCVVCVCAHAPCYVLMYSICSQVGSGAS